MIYVLFYRQLLGSNLETISKFEIVPSRNTEDGLPLRKINTKLYEILKQEDMQTFYIRFI